ncbi:MAG: sugar phosphate isomerase/epimerase [Planctomycetota bacterium]|nr:MAG: sugar phosphate isomerase/epimerase [Planctomycetota bacterium]REK27176.1 MAG: sugar phosphate isomerase/epimerase [Planctomycetota bacterium]REK36803.1 MAG: sugar phosphate isomerase/epimerase [Planctomycetota bacterium]
MSRLVSRREFLASSAAAAGSLALSTPVRPAAAADKEQRLYHISLAEWSLHKSIFGEKLDHLDFAKVAREEFGIDAVEYVNQFFKDKAQDKAYLADMRQRAEDHGVNSLLIMIDGEGRLGDPDDGKRAEAIENHKKWVEAAAELRCHSIRVNAASGGSYADQLAYAADGLYRLALFAEQHRLAVIVENHGGLSSNGEWLAGVMRRVDHPHCGTLPDFGNFRISEDEWYDVYLGVEELMPYAKAVSAKSYNFDEDRPLVTYRERDGMAPLEIDYGKMMKIVVDSGYRGHVGIEYEGDKLDEHAGILKTKALLEQVHDELTA